MATNFPDTSINNPNTGVGWANGDAFDDTAESGLIYYWYDPVWKTAFTPTAASDARYVEVAGDTMTGQLGLPGGGSGAEAIQVQEVETLIAAIDDTDYVSKTDTASQNIASDVTINTNKIVLYATDGSATFAGGVTAKSSLTLNHETSSSQVLATGRSIHNDNDIFLRGSDQNGDQTWGIESKNGSATFGGDVKIGGTLPSAPNISLNADGSATFGSLLVGTPYVSDSQVGIKSGNGWVYRTYFFNNGGVRTVTVSANSVYFVEITLTMVSNNDIAQAKTILGRRDINVHRSATVDVIDTVITQSISSSDAGDVRTWTIQYGHSSDGTNKNYMFEIKSLNTITVSVT